MTILHPGDETAILEPDELRKLIQVIPKARDKDRFEFLLYTGCRYTEAQEVHGKYDRLKNGYLKLMNTKYLSRKKAKYRYVRLNRQGERVVENFFRGPNLPTYQAWWQNLKRWCDEAGIDKEGVGIKTTRKTWESYLVSCYREKIEEIFLSQGHSDMTALKHYITTPFTDDQKKEMLYFVEGW